VSAEREDSQRERPISLVKRVGDFDSRVRTGFVSNPKNVIPKKRALGLIN
jgi:hypothetical protein